MRLLRVVILAATTLVVGQGAVAATAPALKVACGIPNGRGIVTCRLSGSGFHPHEVARITYRLVFTALPLQHGKHPAELYDRTATTDSRGQFVRPPLGFAVVKYHESFRLMVTVVGASGDRASTTYTAIAQ